MPGEPALPPGSPTQHPVVAAILVAPPYTFPG